MHCNVGAKIMVYVKFTDTDFKVETTAVLLALCELSSDLIFNGCSNLHRCKACPNFSRSKEIGRRFKVLVVQHFLSSPTCSVPWCSGENIGDEEGEDDDDLDEGKPQPHVAHNTHFAILPPKKLHHFTSTFSCHG